MECGDLGVVRYLIDLNGIEAVHRVMKAEHLAGWISKAESHETSNGQGSFLNSSHLFNAELRSYLIRQALGERLAPMDMPGRIWSAERGWHSESKLELIG